MKMRDFHPFVFSFNDILLQRIRRKHTIDFIESSGCLFGFDSTADCKFYKEQSVAGAALYVSLEFQSARATGDLACRTHLDACQYGERMRWKGLCMALGCAMRTI